MKENKKSIIDEYYKETPEQQLINEDSIMEKLPPSLEKMDLLNEMDFSMDINIMEIVAKGSTIADKKRLKYELAGFIAACLSIVGVVAIIMLKTNPKIFLYVQAVLTYLLPLTILPAAKRARRDNQ